MSRAACLLALIVLLGGLLDAGKVAAHQAALAVLSVTETQPGLYRLAWENRPTSAGADVFVEAGPIWPDHCEERGLVLDCGQTGLSGRIGFEALGVAQSAALLKIRHLGAPVEAITLTPATPTATLTPRVGDRGWASMASAFASYLSLGVEHILIGIDHLLFVLGLMWIASGRWMLIKTITAFTVAHSLTLAAVSLGFVGVPESFVNAMIALSIVFVGVEVLRREAGQSSFTLRHPWAVAFGFGLLHGFGFAGALVDFGLPPDAALLALAAFNIGVEIGQLAFVFLMLALAWAWRTMAAPRPRDVARPGAYVIGALAAFWFFDRAAVMLWS